MTARREASPREALGHLRWLDALEVAAIPARVYLDCEDEFVAHLQVTAAATPEGLRRMSTAAAARDTFYLARHGIPRGSSCGH